MKLHGQDDLIPKVKTKIAPGDTMFHGSDDYYFECGASALRVIQSALINAGKSTEDVRSVLDYASGYGRVLRWLEAGFPEAQFCAADTDHKALASVREMFGVKTREADVSMTASLGQKFDLIWSGSLATHLSEANTLALLKYLKGHLAPSGVVVTTIHGTLVADRLRTGESLYGLDAEDAKKVVKDHENTGYGYADYPRQTDYGISITAEDKIKSMARSAGLTPVYFEPKAWVSHQDAIGAVAE